jgi:dienelactone hydrolase
MQRRRIAKLVIAGSASVFCLRAQTLTITPNRVLTDQIAVVRATGLQPGEHVTLKADLVDGEGQRWESDAEFAADDHGGIDLSTQAPVKASYKETSAMGPIWSMMPVEKGVSAYRPPRKLGSQEVRFQLIRGGAVIATAQLQQDAAAEGIRQIKIEGQLHGILFVPAGGGHHPGVLVLGGSEGGLPSRRAAWLASRGYVAFALAYFRYENLPAQLEAIPLEYFGQALGWMKSRPEISAHQIGVMGGSRGGELALQLGSMYPLIKAVVAFVPANVRHRACCGGNLAPYAWTWKGMPLAFVGRDEHGAEALRAAIDVESTSGPILLVAGEQDHVWDSAGMTRATVARLKHKHFTYQVESLVYPHAGHIAGRPEIVPEWHGQTRHPVSGRPIDFGGTPDGNARSSIDAIPKVLEFLRQNLSDPAPAL